MCNERVQLLCQAARSRYPSDQVTKRGTVSIRFLSPLECFFQLPITFILFKPCTSCSFISFVPKYFL